MTAIDARVAIAAHEKREKREKRERAHSRAIDTLKARLVSKSCTDFHIHLMEDGVLEYSYKEPGGCQVSDDLDLDFKGVVEDTWGHFRI